MIDIDKLIYKTLNGLPKSMKCEVFKFRAVTEEPTYIVYYIWDERDITYAGNEPIGLRTMATVNIYSYDEAKKLVKAVKEKFRKAGFFIVGSHSVFNDETERIQNIIEISYEDF